MSLRKTLVLAILLLACVGYLQWFELPKQQKEELALKPLKDIRAEAIEFIEIGDGEGSFRLKNRAPKAGVAADPSDPNMPQALHDFSLWELESVPGSKLDPQPLRDLVAALTTIDLGAKLPAKELSADRAVYGLDKPTAQVRVVAGGSSEIFTFGKMNDYLRKRYVTRNGGDALYLVSEPLFQAARKPVDDYRKRTPIEFVDGDLASISVSGLGLDDRRPALELVVNDAYQWRLVKPGDFKASDRSVAQMTQQLRQLRAVSFADDSALPAKDFGLDKPYVQVTLAFKGEQKREPLVISIGRVSPKSTKKGSKSEGEAESNPETKFWMELSGHPSRYELATDPLPSIYKELDVIREKQQMRFAVEQVKRVVLEVVGQPKIELARDQAGWKLGDKPADGPFVDQFLNDVSELSADRFVKEPKDFGLAKPRVQVVVEFKDDTVPNRKLVIGALVGKSDKDGYFAAVDEQKEVFIISPESYRKIARKGETFIKVASDSPSQESKEPQDVGTDGVEVGQDLLGH